MWKWNVWVWAEDEGKELCGMQPTEQKDAWNGGRSGGLLSASPDSDRRGVRLPASEQRASISSRAVCRRPVVGWGVKEHHHVTVAGRGIGP
jgi:hypothetical protein